MITRLEGDEESQNSDEWQLQGGPLAGTAKALQRPSSGNTVKLEFLSVYVVWVFESKAGL